MKTRAKRTSNGYVLNGAKMWITNSPIADIAVVWAKLEAEGIHGFIVEKRHEGLLDAEDRGQVQLARVRHRRNRAG
jgi:glutaryl-CoA dehydrogenase